MMGGALATAGNLVFAGEGNGQFDALDAKTGKTLWHFQLGAGVNAPPITYEVDGTQYVAVAAGGKFQIDFHAGTRSRSSSFRSKRLPRNDGMVRWLCIGLVGSMNASGSAATGTLTRRQRLDAFMSTLQRFTAAAPDCRQRPRRR